ncbi:MAG TPA: dipeptide ABC transporter ATP-binding protein [Steroidobacteraceae bacterium]|nr:dipeptide ABC transporter ATP-binding protein [Steroidobacteraceae bacterium]
MSAPVLDIRDLGVTFATPGGAVEAVSDLSLTIAPGECVGIVGESGAGKSQAFLAVTGLLPANASVRGSARFEGQELLGRPASELDRVRGSRIGMIFQDPLTSLTPHLRIGDQIAETLVRHTGASWKKGRAHALALLERVQVTDPARRLTQYPHELSGGMRQRVMIAMALACGPKLLIADEPTTALDVTIQAQILALLAELKRAQRMALALITHDLGIVAGIADRVAVMQAGRIVEVGAVDRILRHPEHAYTHALLQAVPSLRAGNRGHTAVEQRERAGKPAPSAKGEAAEGSSAGSSTVPLLSLVDVRVHFRVREGWFRRAPILRAVEDVSLVLNPGEVVGLVGESGSGKSTLARAALRLVRAETGHIVWLGNPLDALTPRALRPLRREMQLVFQDPLASLDPRMTVAEIVAEPLCVHRRDLDGPARREAAAEMLLRVGLGRNLLARYPHELSGGQAQRVAIARAMVLRPKLLVCDEAVSALDVSVQAQILALLQDLKREYRTAILFISHNLAVVRQLCDRVLVLYLGRMMEEGPTESLYTAPAHPYTRGLLEAVPVPDPDIQPQRWERALGGELPSPLAPPSGCVFRTRCPHALDVCGEKVPGWEATQPGNPGHHVACHRWRELAFPE